MKNINNTKKTFFKNSFVLTQKNQKGQVAIFVALIFQVVFIFFALLINVGLLVHHKINLQQSTDLAAYYGAMKQAEMLNAMSHVNYQIRQAWKLLTWRYRVVGTFGMQQNEVSRDTIFPIKISPPTAALSYNPGITNDNAETCNVSGTMLGPHDIPFFCIGHAGMGGWPSNKDETFCKVSCANLSSVPTTINYVPNVSQHMTPLGGDLAGAVQTAINKVNTLIDERCDDLGLKDVALLSNFLMSYQNEVEPRVNLIKVLQGNLTAGIDVTKDLDSKLVKTGITNTFLNNLTDANKAGDNTIISTTSFESSDCKQELLNQIKFDFLQFYLNACTTVGKVHNIRPTFLYSDNGDINESGDPNKKITSSIPPSVKSIVEYLNGKYTVGFEKNPWCQAYIAVKSTSTPKIPFLPISKIKLSAIAVAKPFGGTIGPWYKKTWASGSTESYSGGADIQPEQTDKALPIKKPTPSVSLNKSTRFQMNFSRYIGDDRGVSDVKYLAYFQSALLTRNITNSSDFYNAASDQNNSGMLDKPTEWPHFNNWSYISDASGPKYDPLALNSNGSKVSFLRALEIAAISPNLFDTAYYSIEPDFYHNYYLKLRDNFSNIQPSGFSFDNKIVRPDFGANDKTLKPELETFGVKDQLQVFRKVFGEAVPSIDGMPATKYATLLPENLEFQFSLLSGWTFLNFSDYSTFPNQDLGSKANTMSFGRCADSWSADNKTPMDVDANLPPTPGNCVTGGRSGYSVKIVSPAVVRDGFAAQEYGGPGQSGPIKNPINEGFFNFN